jgi:hypothetical protein
MIDNRPARYEYSEMLENRLLRASADAHQMSVTFAEMRRTLRIMRLALIKDAPEMLRESALEQYDKVMKKAEELVWQDRII